MVKKLFPIIASISALIIALSIAYYFVLYLPSKEKAAQELQQQELEFERQKLETQQSIELEKAKTPYDKCYTECNNLRSEPVNDKCDSSYSKKVWSASLNKYVCKTNEGACMVMCSQLNK